MTANKNNEIAIIELKFFDNPKVSKLEVVAQLLNYVLFFYSYKKQLLPLLKEHLGCDCEDAAIKGYIVSNGFHKRFPDVWRYYSKGYIPMHQVVMGHMTDNA